jgi:hypothetical protein
VAPIERRAVTGLAPVHRTMRPMAAHLRSVNSPDPLLAV